MNNIIKIYNCYDSMLITKLHENSNYNVNEMIKDENTLIDTDIFLQKYPNYKPMKIIGNNIKNFKYVEGINENNEKFIPDDIKGNGLYFTDEINLWSLTKGDHGNYIAYIKLLDNEKIWINRYMCKTHKFKIIKIETINDYVNNLSTEKKILALKKNGLLIKYIKNKTEEMNFEAVKQQNNPQGLFDLITQGVEFDEYAIQYIENPSEKVQLEALKKSYYVLKFIKNPSEQVQLEAVKKNAYAIQYIENPSEQVQLKAVKQNGHVIQHIGNPSEQVQLKAVKQNGHVIQHIGNPSEKVQLEALSKNYRAIEYIKNPSIKVKITAFVNGFLQFF
jgi:hypothetical protein